MTCRTCDCADKAADTDEWVTFAKRPVEARETGEGVLGDAGPGRAGGSTMSDDCQGALARESARRGGDPMSFDADRLAQIKARLATFQTKPNPKQPMRCPSIDPHDTLQCTRAIHDDDQCQAGGIAWRKGSPRIESDRERADRLQEDVEEYDATLTRQRDLLTRTVNALRGNPPPLTSWSHHDIPELAAEKVAEIARLTAERDALQVGRDRDRVTGHKCEPYYSRSECGQCGWQEQWCATCSRQMCGCATGATDQDTMGADQ